MMIEMMTDECFVSRIVNLECLLWTFDEIKHYFPTKRTIYLNVKWSENKYQKIRRRTMNAYVQLKFKHNLGDCQNLGVHTITFSHSPVMICAFLKCSINVCHENLLSDLFALESFEHKNQINNSYWLLNAQKIHQHLRNWITYEIDVTRHFMPNSIS